MSTMSHPLLTGVSRMIPLSLRFIVFLTTALPVRFPTVNPNLCPHSTSLANTFKTRKLSAQDCPKRYTSEKSCPFLRRSSFCIGPTYDQKQAEYGNSQLYRDSLPTFKTAAFDDILPTPRVHARKKPMDSFSSPVFGLVCTFWHDTTALIIILVLRRCQLQIRDPRVRFSLTHMAGRYYNGAYIPFANDAR